MKELNVKRVSVANVPVEAVPMLLDEEKIPFQLLDTVNWQAFPYKPSVQFRMAHSGDAILLHYKVKEASVRAVAAGDNGPVWEDSCVEFFSSPVPDGTYYNMECNCAGTLLIGGRRSREDKQHAPQAVLEQVKRWSSLGRGRFEERVGECAWEVALFIPCSAYFRHDIKSFAGLTIKANFYKCGDKLQKPHYLSWNPIEIEKPDFHRPDFFGTLYFE